MVDGLDKLQVTIHFFFVTQQLTKRKYHSSSGKLGPPVGVSSILQLASRQNRPQGSKRGNILRQPFKKQLDIIRQSVLGFSDVTILGSGS